MRTVRRDKITHTHTDMHQRHTMSNSLSYKEQEKREKLCVRV